MTGGGFGVSGGSAYGSPRAVSPDAPATLDDCQQALSESLSGVPLAVAMRRSFTALATCQLAAVRATTLAVPPPPPCTVGGLTASHAVRLSPVNTCMMLLAHLIGQVGNGELALCEQVLPLDFDVYPFVQTVIKSCINAESIPTVNSLLQVCILYFWCCVRHTYP